MFLKVQRIWHSSESRQMCINGIFRDELGFYCFQRRETTISKEDTSNSKHSTTQESTTNSSIQWDGIVLQMFYQKIVAIMAPITKLSKKTETFLWT
jgi:hypothetical protein